MWNGSDLDKCVLICSFESLIHFFFIQSQKDNKKEWKISSQKSDQCTLVSSISVPHSPLPKNHMKVKDFLQIAKCLQLFAQCIIWALFLEFLCQFSFDGLSACPSATCRRCHTRVTTSQSQQPAVSCEGGNLWH